MQKFNEMLHLDRIEMINVRRTLYVLEALSIDKNSAQTIRADCRKIIYCIRMQKEFGNISRFGLLCIICSFEIGKPFQKNLPWLSKKKSMSELAVVKTRALTDLDMLNLSLEDENCDVFRNK